MCKKSTATGNLILTAVFGCFLSGPPVSVPAFLPSQIVHDIRVTNIEVPVRVFKGNTFIDTLKKEDFEVFEDGVLQQIDAVYLVRKTSVAREEGGGVQAPRTGRLFVLLFEMTDYQPEIAKAMDYFFRSVIEPLDELILMTPMKTYNLKKDMFLHVSPEKIKNDFLDKVRKDIQLGGTEYRGLIRDVVRTMSENRDLDEKLFLYGLSMQRLEKIRYIDQGKLLEFARLLKSWEGQKHVFFFYQKELLPKINPKQLSLLIQNNQERPDTIFELINKFDLYNRDVTFDVKSVREAFSDSLIAVHFLFLTKTGLPSIEIPAFESENAAPIRQVDNATPVIATGGDSFLSFEDQSEDIFSAFSEIAKATGGLTESSASAEKSFQRAAEATENYYLLYYRPTNTKADKSFRKIEVRVKSSGLRVTFRQGYIAE